MNRKLFPAAMLLLLFLLPISCKNSSTRRLPTFEQTLTRQDTADVMQLVDSFFSLTEQGQMEKVLPLLRRVSLDAEKASILPLDSENVARARQTLIRVMQCAHRVDYLKFFHPLQNEVRTTVILVPAKDTLPEMVSVLYLKPVKADNGWQLCLMDARSGDKPLVPIEKLDSMIRAYAAQTN